MREHDADRSVSASLLQERLQAEQLELQQQLSAAHLREAQAARKVAEASAALAEARVTVRHEVEQELFVQKEAVRRDRLALESERWGLWRVACLPRLLLALWPVLCSRIEAAACVQLLE